MKLKTKNEEKTVTCKRCGVKYKEKYVDNKTGFCFNCLMYFEEKKAKNENHLRNSK